MRRLGHLDPPGVGPRGGEAAPHRHRHDVVAGPVEEDDGRRDPADLRERVEAVAHDERGERTGDEPPHVDDRRVGRDEDDGRDSVPRRELDGDARAERAADEDDACRRDAEPPELRERRLAVGVEPLLARRAVQPPVAAVLGEEDAEAASAERFGERQVLRRRLRVSVKVEDDGAVGGRRREERPLETDAVGRLVTDDVPSLALAGLRERRLRGGEDHRTDEQVQHDGQGAPQRRGLSLRSRAWRRWEGAGGPRVDRRRLTRSYCRP